MNDQFRTIIVTAADAPLARMLAALSSGGDGMFTTGLSLDGAAPATHYVSSGFLPASFVAPLPLQLWEQDGDAWKMTSSEPGDAAAVVAVASQGGATVTLAAIKGLFARSDCTTQEPFTAMWRLGLRITSDDE